MKLSIPLFLVMGTLALPAGAQLYRDFDMRTQPWAERGLVLPEAPAPVEPVAPVETTTPSTPPPTEWLEASVTPIPEPTTTALLLAGLGVVGLLYRRRSKK